MNSMPPYSKLCSGGPCPRPSPHQLSDRSETVALPEPRGERVILSKP